MPSVIRITGRLVQAGALQSSKGNVTYRILCALQTWADILKCTKRRDHAAFLHAPTRSFAVIEIAQGFVIGRNGQATIVLFVKEGTQTRDASSQSHVSGLYEQDEMQRAVQAYTGLLDIQVYA